MHIGTTMIFSGILEGVWPIYNQKKCLWCDFRCQGKSGITDFPHTSIEVYTSHLKWRMLCYIVTHHCII